TEQGRQAEATRLEQRAEAEYEELAATRPGSRAQAAALSYKAELYRRKKDWSGAINLLSEVFDKFSTSEIGFRAAITIALIYRDELDNMPAADSVIQELKKRLTTVDESKEF
ncbi:MAG: tetratricopeptide repeat protein, partial [Planctomycetota bacterium]